MGAVTHIELSSTIHLAIVDTDFERLNTRSPKDCCNSGARHSLFGMSEVEQEDFRAGVFWLYISDSAGEIRVVIVNVLCSPLRAFYSERLLNSYCSTGAAQLPTVHSCGGTWQLACANVCNLKAFKKRKEKKHACLVNIP